MLDMHRRINLNTYFPIESIRIPSDSIEMLSKSMTRKGEEHEQFESSNFHGISAHVISVFAGNTSMKKKIFRTITVARNASREAIIAAALRAFHISGDPRHYAITDACEGGEKELPDFMPVQSLTRREGKRPAIFLRYRPPNPDQGFVKVGWSRKAPRFPLSNPSMRCLLVVRCLEPL